MEINQDIQEIPAMSPDPRIRVFRRILHGLEGFEGMEVDVYVILGERYVVLLDTLLCPADMAALMQVIGPELGNRQLLCVNSHADWDHVWGNSYFSGERSVPILAHEDCWQRMNSEAARQKLADLQAQAPVFRDVQLVPPTLTFNEQMTIHAGGLTIELLHAPGHCQDQIVAWLPELRLLLAFDAVEMPLPCLKNAAGVPLMFATLQRLMALNAQRVLCSHGNTTSPALISENLTYVREIERRARLLLAHHTPTEAELEHAAELVGYSFDEVIAPITVEVDRAFYASAHEQNVRATLQWLLSPVAHQP